MPYSGPAAPPTVLMRVRPAVRSRAAGDGPRLVALGSAGVEQRADRGEAAVHVRAVVAVADGLVQRGQRGRLVVDPVGGEPQPGVDDIDHAVVPRLGTSA